MDRAFDANAFLHGVAATGAMFLARARSNRIPPVLQHLPDGSYLSHLDGLPVRIGSQAHHWRRGRQPGPGHTG